MATTALVRNGTGATPRPSSSSTTAGLAQARALRRRAARAPASPARPISAARTRHSSGSYGAPASTPASTRLDRASGRPAAGRTRRRAARSSTSLYSRSVIGAGPSRRRPCRRGARGGRPSTRSATMLRRISDGAALDGVALGPQVAVAGRRGRRSRPWSGRRMVQSSYRRPSSPSSSSSRPEISWLSRAKASFMAEPSGPGWPAASCWRSRSPASRAASAVDPQPQQPRRAAPGVRSSGRSRQVWASEPIMPPSRGQRGAADARRARSSAWSGRPASRRRPRRGGGRRGSARR